MSKVAGVIPARWGSTRFPGKSLAMISGKSMIARVAERALESTKLDEVVVATDDERIRNALEGLDVRVVMTRPDHPSGTDRVAEAIANLPADLILNIQGDEPLIDPALIDDLVGAMKTGNWDMATAATAIAERRQIEDPGVVKVVCDRFGGALYFSRAPIPHRRDADEEKPHTYLRHIGIYAYRRKCLLRMVSEPPCQLEQLEQLEQLRALDMGCSIRVLETEDFGIGVDVPEDIARAEALLRED